MPGGDQTADSWAENNVAGSIDSMGFMDLLELAKKELQGAHLLDLKRHLLDALGGALIDFDHERLQRGSWRINSST